MILGYLALQIGSERRTQGFCTTSLGRNQEFGLLLMLFFCSQLPKYSSRWHSAYCHVVQNSLQRRHVNRGTLASGLDCLPCPLPPKVLSLKWRLICRVLLSISRALRTGGGSLTPCPKAPSSVVIHTWAFKGIPYQNFGIYVYTTKG